MRCVIASCRGRRSARKNNGTFYVTVKMTLEHLPVSSPTSYPQSDHCRMQCSAPRFSGPRHSRNVAVFQSIDRVLGEHANIGEVCKSTLLPSSTCLLAATRSRTVFHIGVRNGWRTMRGAMACPGGGATAEHSTKPTKPFERWPLDIRRSNHYGNYVIHFQNCVLMTFLWVMMAATEPHCGPTGPKPVAARRAPRNSSLALPSGYDFSSRRSPVACSCIVIMLSRRCGSLR